MQQKQKQIIKPLQLSSLPQTRKQTTSRPQDLDQFMEEFYPHPQRQNASHRQKKANTYFEPQFIKSQRNPKQHKEDYEEEEVWEIKPTKEGFLYFHMVGTNTYQWNFPRFYDQKSKKQKPLFVDSWVKRYESNGKKYWQNSITGHTQNVKPESETYLIQSAILGNLAFLELYIKSRGTFLVTDQQNRNALHHSVANGHQQFTIMLCEFGALDGLIEGEDQSGSTPIFMATKYNEQECLKVLIQYNANLFHKKRNGETCLHEAAAYNSWNSIIILCNFAGPELLQQRNRQGLRALDIAQNLGNFESQQVIIKMNRNLGFKTALYEREVMHLAPKRRKSKKSANKLHKNKVAVAERILPKGKSQQIPEYLQVLRQMEGKKQRLNVIEENSSESYLEENSHRYNQNKREQSEELSESGEEALGYLGGKNKYGDKVESYQRKVKGAEHQVDYFRKMKKEQEQEIKAIKTERVREKDKFSDFEKIKRIEEKLERRRKRNKGKIVPQKIKDSSLRNSRFREDEQEEEKERKNQLSGEEEEYGTERDDQVNEIGGQMNEMNNQEQKSVSYLKISIRDDNTFIHSHKQKSSLTQRGLKTNLNGNRIGNLQYQEGFYDNENSIAIDEENQIERRSRGRSLTDRGGTLQRQQSNSLVEKAYSTTSGIFRQVVHFMKDNIGKIKEYVWSEQNQNHEESDENYETAHSRGRSAKRQSIKRGKIAPYNPQIEQRHDQNQYEEEHQYIQQKSRKSRPHKKGRINPNQIAPVSQEWGIEVAQNHDQTPTSQPSLIQKSSASVQTQVVVQPQMQNAFKQPGINKQQSIQSTKSVGVGSIGINDSFNTQNSQNILSQSKQQQNSKILSQKDIKKKMNMSKQFAKKNYQSSEDERKQVRRVESPSPEPQFMKEEIQYLKLLELQKNPLQSSQAFQKIDLTQALEEQKQNKQQSQQELFTPHQRQLLKGTTQAPLGQNMSSNQRYGRNQSNSQSSEAKYFENNPQIAVNNTPQPIAEIKTTSTMNPYHTSPSSLKPNPSSIVIINQQNYSNVNSQDDKKKAGLNTNKLYQIQSTFETVAKQNSPTKGEEPKKFNDIEKFYSDLLKNTSITQVNEEDETGRNQMKAKANKNESIDESNLSALYNKVMKEKVTPAKKEEVKKESQKQEELEFNPGENGDNWAIEQSFIKYCDGESSLESFMVDFEVQSNQSMVSFIKEQAIYQVQCTSQFQQASNLLDKGQFIQNSCASIYNQQQNTSLQRPLGVLGRNNSMVQLNFQYQSDNESEAFRAKTKKTLLISGEGQLNIESPVKKKPLLPLHIQRSQAAGTLGYASENEVQVKAGIKDAARLSVPSKQLIQQQQMMISLFNEEAEQQKLIVETNMSKEGKEDNFEKEAIQKPNNISELSESHFEILIDRQQEQTIFQGTFNARESKQTKSPKENQNLSQLIANQTNSAPMGLSIMSSETIQQQLKKQNKKQNTRYDDQEDSLINFDVSQSKIDAGIELPQTFNDESQNQEISCKPTQVEVLASSLDKEWEQSPQIVIQEKPTILPQLAKQISRKMQAKSEVEVLPLQILQPIYREAEMQEWEGENHSLMNQNQLQKLLMNNMLSAAFADSSSIKLVKRSFLPYQSERAATINMLVDIPATSSSLQESNMEEFKTKAVEVPKQKTVDPEKIVQTSLRKSQSILNTSSQDSILQELDSISRIYNDLETVQEDEAEKTNTLDNQPNQQTLDPADISKQSIKQKPEETKAFNILQLLKEENQEKSIEKIYGKEELRSSVSPLQSGKYHRNIPKVNLSVHLMQQQNSDTEGRKEEVKDKVSNIFYRQSQEREGSAQRQIKGRYHQKDDQEDNTSTIAPYQQPESYTRLATSAYLYNIHTSSDDESKRKNKYLNSKPRNSLTQKNMMRSVNAPINSQQNNSALAEQAKRKQIKDISFKSSNMSVHTDTTERLKENLKLFTKNKLGLQKKRSSRDNSQTSQRNIEPESKPQQ